MIHSRRILPFADPASQQQGRVGRVHRDGSITFRGRTYRTIQDVPPECLALRPDVEIQVMWRKLYRAVAPKLRRGR